MKNIICSCYCKKVRFINFKLTHLYDLDYLLSLLSSIATQQLLFLGSIKIYRTIRHKKTALWVTLPCWKKCIRFLSLGAYASLWSKNYIFIEFMALYNDCYLSKHDIILCVAWSQILLFCFVVHIKKITKLCKHNLFLFLVLHEQKKRPGGSSAWPLRFGIFHLFFKRDLNMTIREQITRLPDSWLFAKSWTCIHIHKAFLSASYIVRKWH